MKARAELFFRAHPRVATMASWAVLLGSLPFVWVYVKWEDRRCVS